MNDLRNDILPAPVWIQKIVLEILKELNGKNK